MTIHIKEVGGPEEVPKHLLHILPSLCASFPEKRRVIRFQISARWLHQSESYVKLIVEFRSVYHVKCALVRNYVNSKYCFNFTN